MIHAAAPHFLWPFAVRYATHQLNLWPRVSFPETSSTLRWTGKVGDASVFRVWGSRAFFRDTSVDKLSARAIPCDVTFDNLVPFYRLFPYRSAPPPPPLLFLAPCPPSLHCRILPFCTALNPTISTVAPRSSLFGSFCVPYRALQHSRLEIRSCDTLRIPLPPPPGSSLPAVPDPESDLARAAYPTVSRLLATVVTYPSFESTATSALVAELVNFVATCCLDYATALVAESESASPPCVGGECAIGTDILQDRLEDFECVAAAVPRFASMLLAPEGDLDAPDIQTPRSYAQAITGPYSS
ncbi:unnamed protein product [Closterium sp. NIES-54]